MAAQPNCSEVNTNFQFPNRPIGRLYSTPTLQCTCGSRVLELLYCYDCGEPFLGGYVVPVEEQTEVFLGSTKRSTDAGGKTPLGQRHHGTYRWYWPSRLDRIPTEERSWNEDGIAISFRSAKLDPMNGELSMDQSGVATGVIVNYQSDITTLPSVPSKCPCCLSSRHNGSNTISEGAVNSPISAMGTGMASKANS